jgi:hypothetical protein
MLLLSSLREIRYNDYNSNLEIYLAPESIISAILI